MPLIVIYDTEYTSWAGAQERDWSGPGECREIIQIGAIKVDWPSGKIIETFNVLVKPHHNPVLSDYIIQLTGITQHDIDMDGTSFEEALHLFMEFCGAGTKALSYGGDNMLLAENVVLTKCNPGRLFGCHAPLYVDISQFIRLADPTLKEKRVVSGELWAHFGLPKPGDADAHYAVFDCLSILSAMCHLHQQNRLAF